MPQIPTVQEVGEVEWCPEQDDDPDVRRVYSLAEAQVPMEHVRMFPNSRACHNAGVGGLGRGNCLVGIYGYTTIPRTVGQNRKCQRMLKQL